MKILLGTGNKHKIEEMTRIINSHLQNSDFEVEILNLNDFDKIEEPIEDGNSFLENAMIKAKYYYEHFKIPTLTDDSGIVVDALNGLPGIFSARYASSEGINATSADNRKKLLNNLKGETNRKAHFECGMVLYSDKFVITTTGKFEGSVLEKEVGENGFGYDTLFFSNDFNQPAGLLTAEQKDLVSHRGKALRELLEQLVVKNNIK